MARVALTPTALVPNGGVTNPAGTASVAGTGNGFTIASPTSGSAALLWLRVTNATAGAGNIVVLAGSQPSAQSSGQGPVTVSVPATTGDVLVGPFDSSRLEQSDGSLTIETSVVLTVRAYTIDSRRV